MQYNNHASLSIKNQYQTFSTHRELKYRVTTLYEIIEVRCLKQHTRTFRMLREKISNRILKDLISIRISNQNNHENQHYITRWCSHVITQWQKSIFDFDISESVRNQNSVFRISIQESTFRNQHSKFSSEFSNQFSFHYFETQSSFSISRIQYKNRWYNKYLCQKSNTESREIRIQNSELEIFYCSKSCFIVNLNDQSFDFRFRHIDF